MTKQPDPPRRSGLTAPGSAVQRLVSQAQEAQDRSEGKTGKGKPGNAGKVGVDQAGRSKATYGISAEAQDIARAIAEAEEISQADVVEVALRLLDQAYKAGRIDLHPFKVPARSLKATWKLERLDEIGTFLE